MTSRPPPPRGVNMKQRKMIIKGRRVSELAAARRLSPLLKTCMDYLHLKQLYRQGWLRAGITRARCESVAEHTLGVTLLALFFGEALYRKLDRAKLLRMALLHDFGEIYAGDIIPHNGVYPVNKHALETASVKKVFGRLAKRREYEALWNEFEESRTPEARLLRELDRFEMALQAFAYEQEGLAALPRFFESADKAVSSPALRKLLKEMRAAATQGKAARKR